MNVLEIPTLQTENTDEMKSSLGRKALIFLMVIAFLNTMGMTIVVPVMPFMTLQHLDYPNNLALVVSWLTASYAICQLIAAPGLGRCAFHSKVRFHLSLLWLRWLHFT